MKSSIIIAFLLTIGLFTLQSSQKAVKLKLKRVSSITLNAKQLAVVKAANIDHVISVRGNKLVGAKGVRLYARKIEGQSVIFALNEVGSDQEEEITVTIYGFSIVGELGSTVLYCSCGSNINNSLGDNCHHYATGAGTKCGGGCDADNEGASCSFTSFNIETGEISQVEGL